MNVARYEDPWVAPPRPTVRPGATPCSFSFTPAKALPLDSEPGCWSAPELFFMADSDSPSTRAAKALCRSCPVREECLELGQNERKGIWGGLTPEERRHRGRTKLRRAPWFTRTLTVVPPVTEDAPSSPAKRKKPKKRKRAKANRRRTIQVVQLPAVQAHQDGKLCMPNVDDCQVCWPR